MSSPVASIGARAGRGRPKGPVDPFTALARRMANPDRVAALLARLIVHEYGEKLGDAAVDAIILLTSPTELPAHKWPDRIAWFCGWREATAGPTHRTPKLRRVRYLLGRGRV
jgi:hypothetical protein